MCADKVDSNVTGLRFAEEAALRQLPAFSPVLRATGTLTFGDVGVEDETITIGTQTYILRDTFDADEDEVIIGATAAETAQNLARAINEGAVSGIVGAGTAINDDVTATVQGSVITLTAKVAGAAGNAVVTTETSTVATFTAATLTGGADAVGTPPVWWPLEPNSYSDFGGQIATVARNPINPSRQRKKGVTTDLDASGGFNQDLTFNNTTRLLQGFFFATMREKFATQPMNGAAVVMTGILAANDDYTAAAGLEGLITGSLILAAGFGVTANNGLKTVNGTSSGAAISVSDSLADEAVPPATAKLDHVGHQFLTSEAAIALNGDLVRLTLSTTVPSTLGLLPGEWIFIGGDGATLRFDNNVGFARIRNIGANYIEFDKVSWAPQIEAGTGDTIQIFFGSIIRNEPDPDDIIRRTYQVERTLGQDDNGTMSEYLVGAVPNELSLNVAQADKLTIDLSFVAVDNEQRTGSDGVKDGTRPALAPEDAYNTSSDFARIKLAMVNDNASVDPLFAFATELTLTINNNVSPNKAIGVLGAFDTSAGTFEVGGSLTAYFANVEAVQAVRNNANVTLDIITVKDNKGLILDVPLLSLGDGRLNVEQDQAIMLPLETNAAESVFGYTLLFQSFPYLPDLAA